MKKVFKMLLWIFLIIILLFGGFLVYITLADYKPPKEVILFQVEDPKSITPIEKDTFSLISWNIGYAGLGAEMDFFYDEGIKVRPTKEQNQKYFSGIMDFIGTHNPDFFLLQEVDRNSKRSYRFDQVKELEGLKRDYHTVFALNYKVPFVPVPPSNPMGKVKGGMMDFSAFQPRFSARVAYPLIAAWPNKLFLLDRCFILSRYPLASGKELVVINTHNSAYVYDTVLRNKEFNIIRAAMLNEYKQGNFVIAGGDWNSNPPQFRPSGDYNGHKFEIAKVIMDDDYLPDGWNWAVGTNAPTNRHNNKAYEKGSNGTTVLDYFIISPNVELLEVKVLDLEFEYSDHNPVFIEVRLIQPPSM